MTNWNDIYDTTTFMAKDNDGTEVTFTRKEGLSDSISAKTFAIITAWNPDNTGLPLEENKKRNELLRNDLIAAEYSFYPSLGTGTDGHSEESFTIENMTTNDAISLGAKYGQYAIAAGSGFEGKWGGTLNPLYPSPLACIFTRSMFYVAPKCCSELPCRYALSRTLHVPFSNRLPRPGMKRQPACHVPEQR